MEGHYLLWFLFVSVVVPVLYPFYSRRRMAEQKIRVGDRVPQFTLTAANQGGVTVSFQEVLARGPAIVEFLRGTW